MRQILLKGTTAPWDDTVIIVWAPDQYVIGDTIRWNGCPWRVDNIYGTRFASGLFAKRREKPNDSPLEKLN